MQTHGGSVSGSSGAWKISYFRKFEVHAPNKFSNVSFVCEPIRWCLFCFFSRLSHKSWTKWKSANPYLHQVKQRKVECVFLLDKPRKRPRKVSLDGHISSFITHIGSKANKSDVRTEGQVGVSPSHNFHFQPTKYECPVGFIVTIYHTKVHEIWFSAESGSHVHRSMSERSVLDVQYQRSGKYPGLGWAAPRTQ